MALTVLLAIVFLFMLLIIFGLTFFFKGWKVAFIATGISLVFFAVLFVAIIQAIVSFMPN